MQRRIASLSCLSVLCAALSTATDVLHPSDDLKQVAVPWNGQSHQELWNEYNNIFRHGNRNAASHLWSTFLLERSAQMTHSRLEHLFGGFCAVSGSPVRANDYNRYYLELETVTGGKRGGFMHYCCWPCVCDTQDFIRVDSKTIPTAEGPRKYWFAVLGNPCDFPEKLHEPFVQPFYGRGETTLAREAREVRCVDGRLQGATMSDNGYVIISMFFDLNNPSNSTDALVPMAVGDLSGPRQPGRVRTVDGVMVQHEDDWYDTCEDRARNGYNSGMGEIFRKVAAISPIRIPTRPTIGA